MLHSQTHLRSRPISAGHLRAFEAVARHLNFRAAAEEMALTQSAVSRQIKTLEDYLGVALFDRRPRALALTDKGEELHRVAIEVLDRLQSATDAIKAQSRTRQIAITTTTGFASLWLIPRLQRFTSLHRDIDVRISATTDILNLERSLIDVAVRYCKPDVVPAGAVRLFGEEVLPVCSPSLLHSTTRFLRKPQDLVITDLSVFTIDRAGMTLTEIAPGVSLDEIRRKTRASFAVRSDLA